MMRQEIEDLKREVDSAIKKNGYTHIVVRAALLKGSDPNTNFLFGRVDYSKESIRPVDDVTDYGNFELVCKVFDISESDGIIADLIKGEINLGTRKQVRSTAGNKTTMEFLPSGYSWWILESSDPVYCIQLPTSGEIPHVELAAQKGDLPFFVNVNEAIRIYMHLAESSYSKACIVMLSETRGRIKSLTIVGKELIVELDAAVKDTEFVAKITCRKGKTQFKSSPAVNFAGGVARFECSFEPDQADVALVHLTSGDMLDMKKFEGLYSSQKGIIVKTPESLISEMIEGGENKNVEFKLSIFGTEEWLESISSFANSEGGTIIIGVTNNKEVRGFHDDPERSEKSVWSKIRSSFEPSIEPRIQWANVDGKPLLLIRVDEGTDKPYNVKGKGIYIRDRDTDVIISRAQLDRIYSARQSSISPNR